jgi:hypothetical protein
MYLHKYSWIDYFSGNPVTTYSSQEFKGKQSSSSSSVYVSNCLFISISSTGSGGALYCGSATYFLVELTSFFTCSTTNNHGGAIYFSYGSGQCVLHKVCGYDCCSTYTSSNPHYQFAYISVNNSVSSKNYINYSSISRCVNDFSNSYYILCLIYGKICCPSVNISMNKCKYYSGIYCYPFSDSNSVTCSLSYFSFADNNALGNICIYFNREGPKYEMKCCNIIRNAQVDTSNGLIFVPGNWMIEDSCILENNAYRIFHVWGSYTFTLSNCTVDKTTSYGSFRIQNTATKSFIHGLNHMSTQNCHSEYDSARHLTAVPYVSGPTKRLFCYTYKIYNCQARISDFFSFNCLFMILFIHPNPSEYCWYYTSTNF